MSWLLAKINIKASASCVSMSVLNEGKILGVNGSFVKDPLLCHTEIIEHLVKKITLQRIIKFKCYVNTKKVIIFEKW